MHINDELFFNDRSQQGKFLDWAHERIKKEIEDIEYMEEEYGTAEWTIPTDERKPSPRLTDEQKLKLIEKVDGLRDDGYTYRLACECCDVAHSSYTKWRKQFGLPEYKQGGAGIST